MFPNLAKSASSARRKKAGKPYTVGSPETELPKLYSHSRVSLFSKTATHLRQGAFFIGEQPHFFTLWLLLIMNFDIFGLMFTYTLALLGLFVLTGIAVGLETALYETTGLTFNTLPQAVWGEVAFRTHNATMAAWKAIDNVLCPTAVAAPRYFDSIPAAPAPKGANINSSSKEELLVIPGIGEVLADRIIAGRPYADISDVARVKGMGPKKLEALKSWAAGQ